MRAKYAASVLVLLAAGCSPAPTPAPDASAGTDSGLTTVTLNVGMH